MDRLSDTIDNIYISVFNKFNKSAIWGLPYLSFHANQSQLNVAINPNGSSFVFSFVYSDTLYFQTY